MSCSLKDFLEAFAQEHALTDGGEIILDISPDELAALGDFMVRGICGWALGLKANRRLPRLIEVTPSCDALDDELYEQSDKDKDPIN